MAKSELRELVEKVHLRALKAAAKALLEPGDEGYDPVADVRWADRPIRVAAGLMLAQKALEHVSATEVGRQQLGIMLVRERIRDPKAWEALAGNVDASVSVETTTTQPLRLPVKAQEEG